MNDHHHDVIIIGGGIVGLACAAGLKSHGITDVAIYEKATCQKPVGAAIGLFPNGHRALKELSRAAADKVTKSCVSNNLNVMKDASDGKVLRETDVKAMTDAGRVMPDYLVWYLLQQYLTEDLPAGALRCGHVFESFEDDDGGDRVTVRVVERATERVKEITCRVLIGADGIRSTVRGQLWGDRERYYHDKMMFRGVMPIDETVPCPPAGTSVAYQGDEKGKLFAFRETAKGIVTITSMAVIRNEPRFSQDDEEKKERLKKLFESYPEEVQKMIEAVPSSAIREDAVYSIDVEDVWSRGNVVILGDAAHAMTPGLGQGANQGLEDACELVHELARALKSGNADNVNRNECEKGSIIPEALESFWKKRVDRVKEVSFRSRDRTGQVNASSNKNAMSYSERNHDGKFMEQLYSWKPSYLVAGIEQ